MEKQENKQTAFFDKRDKSQIIGDKNNNNKKYDNQDATAVWAAADCIGNIRSSWQQIGRGKKERRSNVDSAQTSGKRETGRGSLRKKELSKFDYTKGRACQISDSPSKVGTPVK